MKRKLTPKQKKYSDIYLKTGVGTKAALESYDTDDYQTAAAISSENLRKPKVIQYLEDNAEKAAGNIVELGDQRENLNVALGANKDILDRAGFKPIEKTQSLNVNVEVVLDKKTAAIKKKYEEELRASLDED